MVSLVGWASERRPARGGDWYPPSMRCPNCGTLDGRVIDSRDLDDSTTIRRRRECSSCRSRYTTYERVESARLIVVKTDGSREEFDREKLAEGLKKALVRRTYD